jgi:hypothetical protein
MPPEQYEWDFFIAHAGPDQQHAEKLYKFLARNSRVFLDSRELKLGDDWDIELPRAQKKSLVTVVLVSAKTEAAYYLREEIAAAIALARKNAQEHRVVPVFLNRQAESNEDVHYGLRLKHGVTVSAKLTLKTVAERLLDLLSQLVEEDVSHVPAPVPVTTVPESKETSSNPVQHRFPEELVDFENEQGLFKKMLADSSEKRLMFIQAHGGRGKSSLLRLFEFHCAVGGVPCCSIDFRGDPYDYPHFTLALVICNQLGLSPRHLAQAAQPFSVYKFEGEIDDPNTVSQILAGISVTHDGLRPRHIKELLKNAFLNDLNQFVEEKGPIVCLFDTFERISEEEENWVLDTLLKAVAVGTLKGVTIITAGQRWPSGSRWEWERNTHLLETLPLMKAEHIKIYAERGFNLKMSDEEARYYWKASAGIPLHMVMIVHNLTLNEAAS